jgi:transposase
MMFVLSVCGVIDLRFCDEVAFNLEPNVPYGWNPIGEQQGMETKKGGNLNVFGLLNVHTGALNSYTTKGKVDSTQVIEWLDDFVTTMTKPVVLIMDNAPWHKSKLMMARIEEWQKQNLFIYFIPPYSPHLNLIEILWRMMKYKWLRPIDFTDSISLHARINYILANYHEVEFAINYNPEKLCA